MAEFQVDPEDQGNFRLVSTGRCQRVLQGFGWNLAQVSNREQNLGGNERSGHPLFSEETLAVLFLQGINSY